MRHYCCVWNSAFWGWNKRNKGIFSGYNNPVQFANIWTIKLYTGHLRHNKNIKILQHQARESYTVSFLWIFVTQLRQWWCHCKSENIINSTSLYVIPFYSGRGIENRLEMIFILASNFSATLASLERRLH